MARLNLVALCSVLSFFYVSKALPRHSLTDRPRLSTVIFLLISSAIFFASSHLKRWCDRRESRPASGNLRGRDRPLLGFKNGAESGPLLSEQIPSRSGKWHMPVLVACVVFRLEAFHSVNNQQQCATPGVESFVCLILVLYQIWGRRSASSQVKNEDPEDPWRTYFDDIRDWLVGPSMSLILIVVHTALFAIGTYMSLNYFTRSTFICLSPIDNRMSTLAVQTVGVILDVVIVIVLWQILFWTKSTKSRLRTLASVLAYSAVATSALSLLNAIFGDRKEFNVSLASLYTLDVVVDSFIFALLTISTTSWICDATPAVSVCVTTFLVGIIKASENVFRIGDWLHLSKIGALVPLSIIIHGTVVFCYLCNLKTVIYIRRGVFCFLLLGLLIVASEFTLLRWPPTYKNRHPINELIFAARTEHAHWLVKASESKLLKTAVLNYKERHAGRSPPPHFDAWFEYALQSPIVDEFRQMDRDLQPFWSLSPSALRDSVEMISSYPQVAVVRITGGNVSVSGSGDQLQSEALETLSKMVKKFSQHLPDMKLPINMNPSPRILPSWQTRGAPMNGRINIFSDMISARSTDVLTQVPQRLNQPREEPLMQTEWKSTRASTLRRKLKDACSSRSSVHTRPIQNLGEFCWSCAKGHSVGSLFKSLGWHSSLNTCSQPDIKYLHAFSLTDPPTPPIEQLLPLFSASKTEEFSDILIPLPQLEDSLPDLEAQFSDRIDKLFWRGSVGEHVITPEALRGSHKLRLLHLIDRPYAENQVTMLMRKANVATQFQYQRLSAAKARELVPIDVGIDDYTTCLGDNCKLVEEMYGNKNNTKQQALEHRYVLLLDDEDGPSRNVLRTLKSQSVPFISTIFRTWYSERLKPWLHFVPIDPRYQALHTTVAYFSGVQYEGSVTEGRVKDAEYIAKQGQHWAKQVLEERDMEIYLFRLLLEWGRLISNDRHSVGFEV